MKSVATRTLCCLKCSTCTYRSYTSASGAKLAALRHRGAEGASRSCHLYVNWIVTKLAARAEVNRVSFYSSARKRPLYASRHRVGWRWRQKHSKHGSRKSACAEQYHCFKLLVIKALAKVCGVHTSASVSLFCGKPAASGASPKGTFLVQTHVMNVAHTDTSGI